MNVVPVSGQRSLRRFALLAAAVGLAGLAACGTVAQPLPPAAGPGAATRSPAVPVSSAPQAVSPAVTPSAAGSAATHPVVIAARPPEDEAVVAGPCSIAPYGPLRSAPGAGRTVALTFDDGPGASTAAILAVLARYGVPATFFNIGANMAARPDLVRAEATAGYVLGDHTWDHPNLLLLPAGSQAAELDREVAEQRALTGAAPCLFRPPYGNYNSTTLTLAQARRMTVWLWSVDTQDWMANGSGSSYWIQRIINLAETEGGRLTNPVVLMHNQPVGNPATLSALPTIIEFFRARGYTFVTL